MDVAERQARLRFFLDGAHKRAADQGTVGLRLVG